MNTSRRFAQRRGTEIARQHSELSGDYLCWNAAVAEVVYPVTDEPSPAYMDLETDRLRQVAVVARCEGRDPRAALSGAVRGATTFSDGSFSLLRLVEASRRWDRASVEPPPCLAFLALSVLAAEDMGKADEGLAPHAYYPRLSRLLVLPDGDRGLRRLYPLHAEFLWECVNTWLENLDGARGLPTAYALTHRYVGLPMSQALVREGDRRRLPEMFVQFGLSPGMRLAPEDLLDYLDLWITSESSAAAANLRKLWQRAASHERIAAIAAVELANWDGAVAETSSAAVVGRVSVLASLRSGFRGSSLDLALGLRPVGSDMDGRMEVLETAGEWSALGFSPGVAGLWRSTYTETIDFGSMLTGLVRVRHGDGRDTIEYKRFPANVVPLVYDDLQSAYIQSERLQLGVDSLLLVHTDGTASAAATLAEVERVLLECARPGHSKVTALAGLPSGWMLFTDVQMFRAPTRETRLNELVPLARNQLVIAGGLRMPSRIRKWSSLSPPEIRATSQGDARLRVVLDRSPDNEQIFDRSSDTGSLVIDLSEFGLIDGDYSIALFSGDGRAPIQQASLRLRSSAEVDPMWNNAPRLVYSLDTPLGALSASEGEAEDGFVDGLVTVGESDVVSSVTASPKVFWADPQKSAAPSTIRIGTPDPTSCIVTGAHRIQLPAALGGRAPRFVAGTCSQCGLVKRYPGWLPRNRGLDNKSQRDTETLPTVTVSDLPSVEQQSLEWSAALDALMHLGGGPYSSLRSVAAQLDGSALFADVFTRRLEALGHIAMERDDRWQPTRWEISPTCLAEIEPGKHRLTGFWPRNAVDSLIDLGAVQTSDSGAGLTSMFLTGIDEGEAQRIANAEDAAFAPHAGRSILDVLPRMSEIAKSLPRVAMPGFDALERFNLKSASWTPSGDPSTPGAYRLRRGFEIVYLFRSGADVEKGLAAKAGVHLVKHLAANEIGKTFLVYLHSSRTLLSPRGCDLPGLYERAAVALSSMLPTPRLLTILNSKRHCVAYGSFDQGAADHMVTLLTT